jgi:hypothetical protein
MHALSVALAHHPELLSALKSGFLSGHQHHAIALFASNLSQARHTALAAVASSLCPERTEIDACETCMSCKHIAAGTHPNVYILEPNEKGTIPIASVRELTAMLPMRPQDNGSQHVIIAPLDALPEGAQNALLKTLEEPPALRSRSQSWFLKHLSRAEVQNALSPETPPAFANMLACFPPLELEQATQLGEPFNLLLCNLEKIVLGHVGIDEAVRLSHEWGSDKKLAGYAILAAEIFLMQALAKRPTTKRKLDWSAMAAELQTARKQETLHLNRGLLLERLFLSLYVRPQAR